MGLLDEFARRKDAEHEKFKRKASPVDDFIKDYKQPPLQPKPNLRLPPSATIKDIFTTIKNRFTRVIDSYIQQLSRSNLYGRKRALELKKDIASSATIAELEHKLNNFRSTGKTRIDNHRLSFFRSITRSSIILKSMIHEEQARFTTEQIYRKT